MTRRFDRSHAHPVVVNHIHSGSGCLKWFFFLFVMLPIAVLVLMVLFGKYSVSKLPDVDFQEAPVEPGEPK